ncbi:hypothetical protein DUNSADRAFT_12110 [Dunaliella salina]|uniref:Encoded protein n=1 Tax=Dunaliella salina TaxID=3046 RepID=A0ABQ7GBZ7_DUNSA|nr:hypothetical protein DUNSADRAFT_12110 [Dunaliella salina]|eukprot:KAF5832128.1 hypothetical protein DUNSADRAFT_12110 [Dunaliella salina]
MGLILRAQLGQAHHLSHAALALKLVHHGFGLLVALSLVVLYKQAQLRALRAEQRVRQRKWNRLILARLQGHLFQRQLQKEHLRNELGSFPWTEPQNWHSPRNDVVLLWVGKDGAPHGHERKARMQAAHGEFQQHEHKAQPT